jgi:hypothetical protein
MTLPELRLPEFLDESGWREIPLSEVISLEGGVEKLLGELCRIRTGKKMPMKVLAQVYIHFLHVPKNTYTAILIRSILRQF